MDFLTSVHPTIVHATVRILNQAHVVDCIFKGHLAGTTHGYNATNTENTPAVATLVAAVREVSEFARPAIFQCRNRPTFEQNHVPMSEDRIGIKIRTLESEESEMAEQGPRVLTSFELSDVEVVFPQTTPRRS